MAAGNDFYCEVQVNRVWQAVGIEALPWNGIRGMRCATCKGEVRIGRRYGHSELRRFCHLVRHDGCPSGSTFDGVPRPHPQALD